VSAKSNTLRRLFTQLKECPSGYNRFAGEMPRQTWERFKQVAWEPEDELTPAVMAGLILYDETFAQLLNEAERSQMLALAGNALERYRQETNPPNQLGKIIAASLEES